MNGLPTNKPGSQAFMVFSMLLLGTFSSLLVVIFDFFQGNKSTLSSVVMNRLRDLEGIPYATIIAISGLSLLAIGFFFYLSSFLIVAVPAILVRNLCTPKESWRSELFGYVTTEQLTLLTPGFMPERVSRRFRDAFLYMLLTGVISENSANIRFAFTQLMFGRSLGAIFVLFSIYACIVSYSSIGIWSFIFPSLSFVIFVGGYIYGINYYEDVMTCGFLVTKAQAKNNSPDTRYQTIKYSNK
ncbi:MAG: hypothetical protein NTX45_08160 [Proteobacteria bacterium]|nr:hypothetical protein [Pseudomonadota bacterium]